MQYAQKCKNEQMILISRDEEIILLVVYKLEGNAYEPTIREQIYEDIGIHWSFGVIFIYADQELLDALTFSLSREILRKP